MNEALVLDKTHFMCYCICPCYGWGRRHDRIDEGDNKFQEHLFNQGREVEDSAQALFAQGQEVPPRDRKKMALFTRDLVKNSQTKIIYQATALSKDNLLAKADIVKVDQRNKSLQIYEVKSVTDVGFGEKTSNARRLKYLRDIGFQKIAFERSGYKSQQNVSGAFK